MHKSIEQVYKSYHIPKNLQQHMIKVAAVASLIADHWNGPEINLEKMKRVLLTHDLGNIVKMEKDEVLSKFSECEVDPKKVEQAYSEYISKFGRNDHLASQEIARELGLDEDEIELMNDKIFLNNNSTVVSSDFDRKICAYADQRVAPNGIQSLLSRLREAQERYKDKPGSSMNNPKTEELIDSAAIIEKQVFANCDIKAEDIDEINTAQYQEGLKHFPI